MRGCLITINKSAKLVDDRAEIVKQLNAEIAQLEAMSIHKYSGNEYYRDDFFVTPSATINQGYYFDAIIDGGEYSTKAEKEEDKIGIASSYDELSSIEKDIVNDTKDGLTKFADAFSSSNDNSAYTLTLIETATGLSSGIIIEDSSGNAMVLTCGNRYGNPCIKVVDADMLNDQLSRDRFDANCVMSNGHVVKIEWALSDDRTTWTINKAGVESILREYVDKQQAIVNDDPQVATSRGEEFTEALLKTVLDHNWWDSLDDLTQQVVDDAYKP